MLSYVLAKNWILLRGGVSIGGLDTNRANGFELFRYTAKYNEVGCFAILLLPYIKYKHIFRQIYDKPNSGKN